jgi:fatty-acyl-CoA synthase
VADWWIPNDAVFVEQLPHTATGKVKKIELREQFADYSFPE